MAGKKIQSQKKIDMGTAPSKAAAKRSRGKKQEEGFIASGDMDRIIPLNNGLHAYLLDPRDGLTRHLQVGSDKWNELIADLVVDDKHGARIQNQLDRLGWS